MDYTVAVVGATGNVGREILKTLSERNFPAKEVIPLASERSAGSEISFGEDDILKVENLATFDFGGVDIVLSSPGASISAEFTPKATKSGAVVIDNTSHYRMDPDVPLVIPEVNSKEILNCKKKGIIANPNCSTIQMVMALNPLHKKYRMKRVVVSTYQSVSGTGVKAVQQLENEMAGVQGEMAYPYPINRNALPHCDVFMENGYTKEEMKLAREPQKIFDDRTFSVTATAVRIPTSGGHSESVNVEFHNDFDLSEVRQLLSETPGVVVQDNPDTNTYPMPIYAHDKDEVFVGRIRRDETQRNTLNMWIVSDNLRKGAATNAVQIAEYLVENKLV